MIPKWYESGDLLVTVDLALGSQPDWSTDQPPAGSSSSNATCDPWHARPEHRKTLPTLDPLSDVKKGVEAIRITPRKGHSRWFEYPTFNVKKACLVSKTWTVAGQSMAT